MAINTSTRVKPGLKLLLTNACGLLSKFGEFSHRVVQDNVDIAIVTETKFSSEKVSVAESMIPGYSPPFRLDRTSQGGGVCVWVKSSLAAAQLETLPSGGHEIIWITVRTKGGAKVVLCSLYRPGSCSEQDTTVIDQLDTCLSQLNIQNDYLILAGDFNVHNSEWLGSSKTTRAGESLEDLCDSHGLTQHVQAPTRGNNPLDLIISNCPRHVAVQTCCPLGKSDHDVVLADFPDITPTHQPKSSRTVWRYNLADWGRLRHFLCNYRWSDVISTSVDESCEKFTGVLKDGMARFIPSQQLRTRPSDPTWWTPECCKAVRSKERLWKAWKRNLTDSQLKANYVHEVERCIRVLLAARHAHEQRLRTKLSRGNLRDRQWWQTVKRACGDGKRSDVPLLTDTTGKECVTATEKAEAFGKFFSGKCCLGENDIDRNSPPDFPRRCSTSMSKIHFRTSEVKRLLSRLDTTKASGPDGIPCKVLKQCASELAEPVTKLFRLIFQSGHQPTSWKTASVIPIHKRASKSVAKNYRPVSLLCVLSKVFESVINKQLTNYLERNHLLSDSQFGFRRGLGTADLLTTLHHHWATTVGNGGDVRVLAIDIAGAFDRVSHHGLAIKLEGYGIEGQLLTWFKSYLAGRQLQAVVEGESSQLYAITAGVPQGSILGPTLFILYTNDLQEQLPSSVETAVYADDTTIYTTVSATDDTIQASQTLQQAVDAVYAWGKSWSVTFEPTKSQSMVISNRRSPRHHPTIIFGGLPVPEEDNIKLLGVEFDAHLNFRRHIRTLATRGNQRLALLRKTARLLDSSGRLTLYKGFVRPVLEYAPLVWLGAAPTHLSRLDHVQHRALRLIGGDVVLQSLRLRRCVSGLSYIYKLLSIPGPAQLLRMLPPRPAPSMPLHRTRRQQAEYHAYQLVNELPAASNDLLRRSFPYGLLNMWNCLPSDTFAAQPSLKHLPAFKQAANRHASQEYWAWDMAS